MNFEQFEVAISLLAEKRYPGAADGVEKIRAKLILSGTGPTTHGTTVRDDRVYLFFPFLQLRTLSGKDLYSQRHSH